MMLLGKHSAGFAWVLAALLSAATATLAQTSEEKDAQFDRIADRYWQTLLRRPSKGTALDLWYQHYAQADRLIELEQKLEQAIAADPAAPQPHLLRGLLLERDRKLAEALLAYERTEQLAPDDYYPVLCRGMLLFRQQRFRDAIAVLQRAVRLQPPRGDGEDAVHTLLRCCLRVGDRDRARQTWTDYSQVIVGDGLAARRLADVVASEGDAAAALELWQQVVNRSRGDPAARIAAEIEIAQLHADQGDSRVAADAFSQALRQLKPGSWLARDICTRIDKTFLEDKNPSGLVEFWRGQCAARPQDLQALERLARALRLSGQTDEALDVYRTTLESAPKQGDLRRSYIEALIETRRFEEAITQSEELLSQAGTDVDLLRMLGQLYLKGAPADGQAAAQDKAIRVWQRIAAARPDDPAAALEAAEACRHAAQVPSSLLSSEDRLRVSSSNARLLDCAEKLYREAVERAGKKGAERAVPYLDHLGEFFHALQKPDEAVAAWGQICAPPNDSAAARFEAAGILFKYDYLAEAQQAASRAIEREPGNFRYVELYINVLIKREQFDAAFEQLARLDAAAEGPVRSDQARRLRLQVYAAGKFSEREIQNLRKATAGEAAAGEDLWLLALLLSQQNQHDAAEEAFVRAVEKRSNHVRLIRDFAEALQRGGKLDQTVAQYERLIALEPHLRTTHYRSIVQLHLRRGRYDLAREVADKLIELAPADVATRLLRVEVARWSGDRQDQITLLKQAVRAAPRDTAVRRQLALALAEQADYVESLAEFWRCWELTPALPERISLVAAISDMLQKAGSRQPLVDQLQAVRSQQPRDVGICLAEAYRRMGEFGQARRTLASLLAEDGRDVDVLRQLAALAAGEQDWQAAIAYQQQVVALNDAWTNVLDWARYYSLSKRDEWLTEARDRQRYLMRTWVDTFREYRLQTQKGDADPAQVSALRQELVNLNWARNKYYDKEQLLDPNSTYQRRYGDIWFQLRLDFEILELASRGPVTAEKIERSLAETLRRAGGTAGSALQSLCQKQFLMKESIDGLERFSAALPAPELLAVAIRDFGNRMLGAEIELNEVELTKLQRIVDGASAARKAAADSDN